MPFVIVVNVTLSTLSLRFYHFFKKELTRMQRCQRIKNYHIISLTNVKELFLFCRFLRIKCFFLQAETFEKRKDFLITKSLSLFLVIASSFLHVIANRRVGKWVGKCAGVKQSPYCTFLLVLSVLRRLLRLIAIRLAMTKGGIRSQ